MDYNLPGSPVHGIIQSRIPEWVAIPFSKGTFPTLAWKLGLLHCRQILYHLSHQGSWYLTLKSNPPLGVTHFSLGVSYANIMFFVFFLLATLSICILFWGRGIGKQVVCL